MTADLEIAMPDSKLARTHGLVVRILEALLVATVVSSVLDVPSRLGIALYTEQVLMLVLGFALALAFLVYPAAAGAKRGGVRWWDWIPATVGLAACTYVAVVFPVLVETLPTRPLIGLLLGAVLIALVLEAARRTSGPALVVLVLVGMVYALFGHLIPGAFAARPVQFDSLLVYLGFDSNALLGAPLHVAVTVVIAFVLMGQVLTRCGGTNFFTDLAMAMMGRYRGGSAKVAVVGSALFGMISGSAVANVSAVGVVTIPLMKRAGFPPMFAAAVEAVGSTGGQMMPPVMGAAAFLMAEYLQVPYGEVMIAAIIPAFLYYFSLFMQVDVESASRGIAGAPVERLPALFEVLKSGWHFILPFVALVVAMMKYNMEAQNAALMAAGILVVTALVVPYKGRRVSLPEMLRALMSTGTAVLDIVLICAAAGALIGILNISGLAFSMTLQLLHLSGNSLIGLLGITAGIGIVLGMGMPTAGVYVIMATLVAPAIVKLGVSAMAAHMFVFYFGMMSMVTPPVALAAYTAASIAKCDPARTGWMATRVGWVSYLVPFLFVYSPALLMQGSWQVILWEVATNALGIWCVTIGAVGYFMFRVSAPVRIGFVAAGLALLFPASGVQAGYAVNAAGLIVATVLLAQGFFRRHAD